MKSSEWNFYNKLYLLEAESYLSGKDDKRNIIHYHASIRAAHEHHFVHKEGLAEEMISTYLFHKGKHGDAKEHFANAWKY